ncbi:hypothetical protein QBC44DRAFT_405250 [Cladorrhinum sp. PSN332]|nr:hypothetical protein QBC44DRAFT_405250 [Cladorrhinum sp. PSN332]
MAELAGGLEAATAKDKTPLSKQTPITVDSLLPPRINAARAWERVAVAPAPGHNKHGKIWKRVGGLTRPSPENGYARAIFELSTQSLVARKRSRQSIHVPKFGDAKWDPRANEVHDGKALLEEARASIARAKEEEEAQTGPADLKRKQATFPDDRLNWVPRKRNNSRWPILSKSDMTRVVANKQPLPLPNAPEPVEIPMKAKEQQMMTRSPRRPTRRISLLPGEDSPRKLQMIPLSPVKEPAPVLSPIKRFPLSPLKVTESPLRKFRVNATPTKIVLESPKSSPPEKSPSKSSPITSRPDATLPSVSTPKHTPTRQTDSPAPLIFDSPVTYLLAEPEYETHRRNSLHLARRSERKSLGGVPLSRLEALRKSPNRRHSFTSLESSKTGTPKAVKGRRNSVDGSSPKRESLGSQKAVEVDIKANIDIFGQWPKAATPTSGRSLFGAGEEQQDEAQADSAPTKAAITAAPQAGFLPASIPSPSPEEDGSSVTSNTEAVDAILDQAAASPLVTPQTPSSEEVDILQAELLEQSEEDMFTPYEPEGLSTIYEESYIEPETPAMTDKQPAPVHSPATVSTITSNLPVAQNGRPATPITKQPTVNAPSTPTERTIHQSHILLDEALQLSIRNSIRKDQPSRHIPEPSSPCLSSSFLEDVSEVFTEDASEVSLLQESEAEEASEECDTNVRSSDSPEPEPAESDSVSPQQPHPQAAKTSPDTGLPVDSENANEDVSSAQSSPGKDRNSADNCPGTALAAAGSPNASDAVARVVIAVPETPGAPGQITDAEAAPSLATPEGQGHLVVDTTEPESSGFTPINVRHSPPTEFASFAVQALAEESEADLEAEDDMDADEIVEQQLDEDDDDVAENSSDDEFALATEAPRPVNDTMQLQAMHEHEDSETEMLRKFVTRVAADKNAKVAAAAAAAALSTQSSRPKRHSGSTNPVTSSTGSPIARADSESLTDRIPLGEKSPNSPSPAKKRKLDDTNDDVTKDTQDEASEKTVPNSNPAPVLKKRRKLGEPFSGTAATSAAIAPDVDDASEEAPRRSTRTRSARSLKPSAPSANAITLSALSMIPVRLPGMGAMDDSVMEGRKSIGRLRNEEKDIAIVTKTNTRKNKGAAVPPPVVLQKQQHDSSWVKLESKRVVDPSKPEGEKGSSKAKTVRWDEQLARYQEADASFKGVSSALLADVLTADASHHDDDEDELAIPTITEVPLPPAEKKSKVVAAPAAEPTRRSNRTRLQAPTPVKKVVASTTIAVPTKPASAVRPKASETAGSLAVRAKAAVPKSKPTPAKDAAAANATKTSTASTKLKRKADSEDSPEEGKSVPGADTKRVVKRVKRDTLPKASSSVASTQSKTVEPAKKVKTAAGTTSAAKSKSSTITKSKTAAAPARSPAGPNSSRISMASAPSAAATKLGMGVNGTPAPKRRGRPPAASTA